MQPDPSNGTGGLAPISKGAPWVPEAISGALELHRQVVVEMGIDTGRGV